MASTLSHSPNRKASVNHSTVTHVVRLLLNDYIFKVVVICGQIINASSQCRYIYYPIICGLFCAGL